MGLSLAGILRNPSRGGVLNPGLLKKPGFLRNLRAITKDFAQKTRFLGSVRKSKISNLKSQID